MSIKAYKTVIVELGKLTKLVFLLLFLSILGIKESSAQKKLEVYDGEDKSKRTSRKMKKSMTGDINTGGSDRSSGPRKDNYIKIDPNKEKHASEKLRKYSGDRDPEEGIRSSGPRHDGAMVDVPVSNEKKIRQLKDYSGDMNPRESRSEGPRHAGAMVNVPDLASQRKQSKKMSVYSGDISDQTVLATGVNRKTMNKIANYSGDLPSNYLEKRAEYREEKSRKLSGFKGDILVKTLEARDRKIRKKNKEIANYQGDIVIGRVKKGMHPSAAYRGGEAMNSYEAKEKYRKRMLKRYRRNDGMEDANYMKEKYKKPKYNKNENEIWY